MSKTTTMDPRAGNGLALLANKCASRTFDISSGMVYASMRDQIVRAQLLICDLSQSDPMRRKLLVVGAGLAGVTAAGCAAHLGYEVVVLESKSQAFALQRGVKTRKVGPFMYEWPSIVSRSQDYPLAHPSLADELDGTPTWSAAAPISADELVRQLDPWRDGLQARHSKLRFFFDSVPEATRAYVQSFVAEHSKAGLDGGVSSSPSLPLKDGSTFEPDYLVLAVGMGTERVHLIDGTEDDDDSVKGPEFWQDDDLRQSEEMDWRVGIFGGGDGALQDVLRLVTRHDHPLDFILALEQAPRSISNELNDVLPQLDMLEHQSRLLRTWSTDAYGHIDAKCQEIAIRLAGVRMVVDKVLSQLRPGTGKVFHVHRGEHFTKAYLLNRFCVHLIEQSLKKRTPREKVVYERIPLTDAHAASTDARGEVQVNLSNGITLSLHRVIVRFGPSKDELEKRQIIKLMPETQDDRTSMAGIPLPYVVAR